MRSVLHATVGAVVLGMAGAASATPLAYKSISNVVVDGATYNVTFLDEALASMPTMFQFTFDSFAHASDAVTAIIARPEFAAFLANANTVSIPTSYYRGFIVPYGGLNPPTANPQEYNSAIYHPQTATIDQTTLYYTSTNNIFTSGDYTGVGYPVTAFAQLGGVQLADLPEPASIAVVAFGLFAVGAMRRRA